MKLDNLKVSTYIFENFEAFEAFEMFEMLKTYSLLFWVRIKGWDGLYRIQE